jgi:hypothetical protein
MSPFNWGVTVDIPCPPGGNSPIPAWTELKFNPLGLYNLRRRLGALPKEPGIFTRFKESFLASDIAWLAAGASEDGSHHLLHDRFHPLFQTFREHTPTGSSGQKLRNDVRKRIQQLLFDTVFFNFIQFIRFTHIIIGNNMGPCSRKLYHDPSCRGFHNSWRSCSTGILEGRRLPPPSPSFRTARKPPCDCQHRSDLHRGARSSQHQSMDKGGKESWVVVNATWGCHPPSIRLP